MVDSEGNPTVPISISTAARDRRATELQAKPREEWTQAELDEYLGYALWSVYSATEMYKDVMGMMPQDPQWLVDIGYLKSWPLNPFDEWRPVKLLAPGDPFSPGDIVWYESPAGPRCYELAIYGADAAAPPPWWCVPLPGHAAWFTPPAGARYTVGAQAETMSERQARYLRDGAQVVTI